jgi:hypothetical protein
MAGFDMTPERVLSRVMDTLGELGVDPIAVSRWDSDGVVRVSVRSQAEVELLAGRGWQVTVAAGLLR